MRWLVLLAACGGGTTQPIANRATDNSSAEPPRLDELLALIKPHAAHSFTGNRHSCPPDETLGQWTGRLVEYGSPKDDGDIHRLTAGCGDDATKMNLPKPTPVEEATYWYCSIDAYSSDEDGESPWSCGLIVRVRKADRSLDLTSIGCPGTC